MTAPPRKLNDAKTPGMWAFDRSGEWVNKYSSCNPKASTTAPLNIDDSKIEPCNSLCRLSINYKPTTCSISMTNNIPTVTFSPNCFLKFQNKFYYLRKMTIHHTSMHTINESYSDLEILLYHNYNSTSDDEGGVILSILLKKGDDYGTANEFMNEFINRMPSNEMPIEKDIDVSSNWNPEQLFPTSKSFFYYNGALPYPPCTSKWTFIIFEEIVPIAQNIIDTVKYMLGPGNKNIRPIQKKPKDITIFYNSNSNFDSVQDISDETVQKELNPEATVPSINLGSTSWLKQNIYYIKAIVITIILILMIYVAIKTAKIIVSNDLLNSFIINQLQKKQQRDYEASQKQMANQQAAEYGGIQQVEKPQPINNNNNNNNNNN
jgi:carbonic anhydrase